MSYFATCTFDLKNGSRDDYTNAYADLAKIDLATSLQSSQGNKIVLPTTTTAGEFNRTDTGSIRDALIRSVVAAFTARGFTSEIFITVGGDWSWGHRTT